MFPGRTLSAELIGRYHRALRELDDGMFERAVERCERGCRFFPAPAEILTQLDPSDRHRLELRRVYGPGGKHHARVANPTEQFERLREQRATRAKESSGDDE